MNDANFTWANIKNGIQYSNDIKNKFLESNLSKENGPFGYVDMIKEKLEAGENVPAFTEWIGNERSHNIDQPNSVLFYKKGECYYRYWIQHASYNSSSQMGVMEFGIVRNNIYDMAVTKITKLGLSGDEKPDPTDPVKSNEFRFNVSLHVKDWTLRDNESIIPYHYGTVGAPTDSRLMFRRNTSDGDMRMYHAEMGYTHTFSEAHKLDFNLSFGKWKSDDNSYYQDSTTYIDPAGPTEYMYQYRPMFINNRSWEAKLDYENQIMENLKLEAGYNGRFSHENTPQESWMDGSSWAGHNITEDKEYFNRFIYDMDVHALYATLTTKVGRLGVMAGLRGEYWRVNTESYTYDQEHDPSLRDAPFKKDYFQLFPSLFLNYPLTETSQLQLNYTRRLRRPWGGQLNSFKNTSDASMVSFGNPELTPEYTNSFSLNYLKTWQNHTLSVGTYSGRRQM